MSASAIVTLPVVCSIFSEDKLLVAITGEKPSIEPETSFS